MMRFALLVAATMLATAPAHAEPKLPAELEYTIFVRDQMVGKSVITVSREKGFVVFESNSVIAGVAQGHDLDCRTVYEADTWTPVSFTYQGTRAGKPVSGTIDVRGDSVFADNVVDGNHFESIHKYEGDKLLFQDYIVEHQVAIIRSLASSGVDVRSFRLVYPADVMSVNARGGVVSEIELDTAKPPAICKKVEVALTQGGSFWGYYDLKRGVPVYLDFPGATTEIFLDAAFPEGMEPKYLPPQ